MRQNDRKPWEQFTVCICEINAAKRMSPTGSMFAGRRIVIRVRKQLKTRLTVYFILARFLME